MNILQIPIRQKKKREDRRALHKNAIHEFENAVGVRLLEATKIILDEELNCLRKNLGISSTKLHTALDGGVIHLTVHFRKTDGVVRFYSKFFTEDN